MPSQLRQQRALPTSPPDPRGGYAWEIDSRRSFIPTDLYGCRLWLDANDGVLVSGAVSQLNDRSGFGHHAVQGTAGKRPAWSATGLNGRAAFTFDGTDDCLRIASMTYGGAMAVTVALVALDTATALSAIVEGLAGGGRHFSMLANPAAGQIRFYLEGTATANSGVISQTLASARRIIATYDYTITGAPGTLEVAAWVDGAAQTLTQDNNGNNSSAAFTDGALNFGARNDGAGLPWAGTLAVFALWNRILSAAEIGRVDAFLRARCAP